MKLSPQILFDLQNYQNGVDGCIQLLDNRVQEIYDSIFKLFKVVKNLDYMAQIKYNIFEDDNVDDCEYCHRSLGFHKINELDAFRNDYIEINIEINTNYYGGLNIMNVDGKILNLASHFPKQWLFDDFEEELKTGYERLQKSYEEKRAKYQGKKATSKEDKLKLQELIKSKLSADELELISFKKK